MTAHERAATRELQRILRPGATVYDIGANIGLFSTQFAHWVGRDGWLYAIEPNPTCIYFLRANLSQLRHRNFAILPVAISSAPGMLDFVLNYGSSLIGVGTDTSPAAKPGHHIAIEKQPLDTLIATMQLRQPDFIKLDVEGAEGDAVAGMMNTLENSRPGLMIELHGRAAAAATLHQLARLGYEYLSCSNGVRYPSAEAVLASLPDACVQVIGYP
jgi:FkbM family methyltransferase